MAVKPLPADYLERPAAAPEATVLGSYTCIGCGHRSASWVAFRAHRAACSGRRHAASPRKGRAAAPPEALVPEPDAPFEERDPFLAAPPEALDALERALDLAQEQEVGVPEALAGIPPDDESGPAEPSRSPLR